MTEVERNVTVGNRIKEARTIRNMTLDEVAEEVKVAKSTIQRYEAAKIQSLKMPVLESIAKALDVNPVWLMGEDVPMERQYQYNLGDVLEDKQLSQIINNTKHEPTEEFALSESEIEMVETFRDLDDFGQDTVKAVLEKESERCRWETEHSVEITAEELRKLPLEQRLKLEPYVDDLMFYAARSKKPKRGT